MKRNVCTKARELPRPLLARDAIARWRFALVLPLLAVALPSQPAGSGATNDAQVSADIERILALPLGDVAGAGSDTTSIPNPYAGDAQAVQHGRTLFVHMNCAGCHGYDAKGGMGPDLTDPYWRYGATPVAVFKSIYEGRPQGMPAWNPSLPKQEIWRLVAYIQSLGGTLDASQRQAWMQGDHPPSTAGGSKPPGVADQPDTGGTPPGMKP